VSEAGYTLAETLAAMAILSLAMGGLVTGAGVLARQQRAVAEQMADTEALRSAQAALERLLAPNGPFQSNHPERFSGAADHFRFDCGQTEACEAILVDNGGMALQLKTQGASRRLALRKRTGSAHFAYESELSVGTVWPPTPDVRQRLRVVALVDDAAAPPASLLRAQVWRQEAVACEFDAILQDCR
jgi:type II secretory pathway pseudopilin PulG